MTPGQLVGKSAIFREAVPRNWIGQELVSPPARQCRKLCWLAVAPIQLAQAVLPESVLQTAKRKESKGNQAVLNP